MKHDRAPHGSFKAAHYVSHLHIPCAWRQSKMRIALTFLGMMILCSACASKIKIDSSLKDVLTEEKAMLIREMIISTSRWGAEVLDKDGSMIFAPCNEKQLAVISTKPFEERFIECNYYVRFQPQRKLDCGFSQLVLDNPEGVSIFETIRPCP